MTETRYIFGNLRTGEVIAELPLEGVSMDAKLNSWGTIRGTASLDIDGFNNLDTVGATVPLQNYIVVEQREFIEYNQTYSPWMPVYGAILWSATYQSQAKTLQFTGRTWEAYLEKVRLREDISWTDYEQRNIFRELWINIQSQPQRNLGVIIPAAYPDAVLKTVEVFGTDKKRASQIVESIADADDGFDWHIVTGKSSSGHFTKTLRIGYPTLGDPYGEPLNFEYPGNITNYYETRSGSPSATHLDVLGAGEGDEMLSAMAIHQDMIDSGNWLQFDEVVSLKDINNQQLLDAKAARLGVNRRPPMTTIKVFVKGDQEPKFGSWALGEYARLRINDARHANAQYDTRIVAFSYRPPSDDNIGECEIVFEGDELND